VLQKKHIKKLTHDSKKGQDKFTRNKEYFTSTNANLNILGKSSPLSILLQSSISSLLP